MTRLPELPSANRVAATAVEVADRRYARAHDKVEWWPSANSALFGAAIGIPLLIAAQILGAGEKTVWGAYFAVIVLVPALVTARNALVCRRLPAFSEPWVDVRAEITDDPRHWNLVIIASGERDVYAIEVTERDPEAYAEQIEELLLVADQYQHAYNERLDDHLLELEQLEEAEAEAELLSSLEREQLQRIGHRLIEQRHLDATW